MTPAFFAITDHLCNRKIGKSPSKNYKIAIGLALQNQLILKR